LAEEADDALAAVGELHRLAWLEVGHYEMRMVEYRGFLCGAPESAALAMLLG
jgi:hypothetical protein